MKALTKAERAADIARLEADRDSWAQQASDRVADAAQLIEERDAMIAAAVQSERERCAKICGDKSELFKAANTYRGKISASVQFAIVSLNEAAAAIRGETP